MNASPRSEDGGLRVEIKGRRKSRWRRSGVVGRRRHDYREVLAADSEEENGEQRLGLMFPEEEMGGHEGPEEEKCLFV